MQEMEKIIKIIEKTDTNDFTFVIPSVAVGNVGQLTVDLLICSYNFRKYATVWHPAIIPSVSADPFTNSSDVSTACELFINENLKIIMMQLRSGIEKDLAMSFFYSLTRNLNELGCKQIIILTSAFSYELHNINSSHFRYISNDAEIVDRLNGCNSLPIDEACIFGGGFASKLYSILKDHFKCTVLMKYSSEGDNRPDAVQMLELIIKSVNNFDNLNNCELVYPESWKYSFGNPPPTGIY